MLASSPTRSDTAESSIGSSGAHPKNAPHSSYPRLVGTVRRNATIDWNLRESARAKMRVMVKRLLRKYGYPPDKQEHATQLVLAQAEVVCEEWAA